MHFCVNRNNIDTPILNKLDTFFAIRNNLDTFFSANWNNLDTFCQSE
jgi:hypothetical protein